jgi:transcriptional regulator with XRE-family HTH domain
MMDRATEDILLAIGRRIAEIRAEKGFTQESFADHAGITLQYLQRLEGGKQNFSIKTLNRLAGLLGVSFDDLMVPPKDMSARSGRPPKKR